VWQSREAVLAKATEDMFGKWGTYIKGEVQVQPCCLAVCDLDLAATSFDESQPRQENEITDARVPAGKYGGMEDYTLL
jgi:hypothetical protein